MILRSIFFSLVLINLTVWGIYLKQPSIAFVEYGVINPYAEPTRLYERADSSSEVVARIGQGGFAKYLHSGKSGKWLYVEYLGRSLGVYHKRVEVGFLRVAEQWVLSLQQLQKIAQLLSVFTLLLFIYFYIRKPSRKRAVVDVESHSNRELNLVKEFDTSRREKDVDSIHQVVSLPAVEVDQEKILLSRKNRNITARLESERREKAKIQEESKKELDEQRRLTKSLENENLHLKKHLGAEKTKSHKIQQVAEKVVNDQQKENRRLVEQNIKLKQRIQEKFKELDRRLAEEAKKVYAPTITAMEQSYKTLVKIHENDLSNARVFDVDLRHPNLDSIIKGRKFEQCIAQCMQNSLHFKILSWTPDKGFLSGVYVQANRDPDLLLEGPNGEKIAIECKFRSEFYKGKAEETLVWSRMKSAYSYRDYGSKVGAVVYVAIGVGGDPCMPNQIYLIPLSLLMRRDFSSGVTFKNSPKDKHFSAPRRLLSNWIVEAKTGENVRKIISNSF